MTKQFGIDIYSDGADLKDMQKVANYGFIDGFTTNPSLMKKAGVKDYLTFAKKVVKKFPDLSISFEVFSNDFETIEKEAKIIHALGSNVFVKVPIITVDGKSTASLIKKLSKQGININVTAIATVAQVKEAVHSFAKGTTNIVSIFVGRIADAGMDTTSLVNESVEICKRVPEARLLWASTREVANVYQAAKAGVDIITVPPTILEKLQKVGSSADQVSLKTVKGFAQDIAQLGYSILNK